MKSLNRRLRLLGLICLTAIAGCSEREPTGPDEATGDAPLLEETRPQSTPSLSEAYNSAPALETCGTTATYRLMTVEKAGKVGKAPGTVHVSNDAEKLYVTYTIDADQAGYFISDTRLSITRSVRSIPLDHRGVPNPWAFAHSGEHEPVTKTYTYIIPLSEYDLKAGDRIVVAAMAGVVYPTTSDWSGPWEWTVMWGIGNVSGKKVSDLANYTVQACEGAPPPPPPTGTTAAITITFDDGWETTYKNAFPVLEKYGLKANVAVNPVPIDQQWTTYMTLQQIQALHGAGWAVVGHGMTHQDLTTLSDSELSWELSETQKWIQGHGFRGAHIFVVPFHNWGDRERAAIKQYYRAARGYAVNQFSPPRMASYPVTAAEAHELSGYEPEFAPYTTAAGRQVTREYLEQAVEEGKFIDIFFHQIPTENVDEFEEMVKILAEYKAYIRTYDTAIP